MSYHETLITEINAKLDALSEQRMPWVARWVAHAICSEHGDGLADNEHRDFWQHCGYQDCRKSVTECINRRAGEKAQKGKSQQLALPGFDRDHLQDYYVVVRDGEEQGVCVLDLTDAEIMSKAEFYRAMGDACHAHARELDRFKNWRRHTRAA